MTEMIPLTPLTDSPVVTTNEYTLSSIVVGGSKEECLQYLLSQGYKFAHDKGGEEVDGFDLETEEPIKKILYKMDGYLEKVVPIKTDSEKEKGE